MRSSSIRAGARRVERSDERPRYACLSFPPSAVLLSSLVVSSICAAEAPLAPVLRLPRSAFDQSPRPCSPAASTRATTNSPAEASPPIPSTRHPQLALVHPRSRCRLSQRERRISSPLSPPPQRTIQTQGSSSTEPTTSLTSSRTTRSACTNSTQHVSLPSDEHERAHTARDPRRTDSSSVVRSCLSAVNMPQLPPDIRLTPSPPPSGAGADLFDPRFFFETDLSATQEMDASDDDSDMADLGELAPL